MAVMTVKIVSPGAVSTRRAVPRLLLRGKDRKLIRSTIAKLKALQAMDWREQIKAGTQGYTPYLFTEVFGSPIDKALTKVIDRATEMMGERG